MVVFVALEGKAKMRKVKTGIQDNTYIEITEGLKPEEEIIIAPYSAVSRDLTDETSIEIVPADRLFSED